jgi:hypothetical protein
MSLKVIFFYLTGRTAVLRFGLFTVSDISGVANNVRLNLGEKFLV